jgi:hypothetical protein
LRCADCAAPLGPAQVDVTSKTEGKIGKDQGGVPLLVKYDTRLRENVAKGIAQEVNSTVQVCAKCTNGQNAQRRAPVGTRLAGLAGRRLRNAFCRKHGMA